MVKFEFLPARQGHAGRGTIGAADGGGVAGRPANYPSTMVRMVPLAKPSLGRN
ncbi:MAG: hypothetical protein JWL74_82 [Alphaproteobacteria bacterium]|nr:hypothetical protein [Alphaproteobacteria bacterium]